MSKDHPPIPGANELTRMLADKPLEYSESVTLLVDALREYMRTDEEANANWETDKYTTPREQWPTLEQTRKWQAHMQLVRLLLKELEAKDVDPWLRGTIDWQKDKHSKW
jgi:hypothetical protein